jgi:hypothetical protein
VHSRERAFFCKSLRASIEYIIIRPPQESKEPIMRLTALAITAAVIGFALGITSSGSGPIEPTGRVNIRHGKDVERHYRVHATYIQGRSEVVAKMQNDKITFITFPDQKVILALHEED